MTFVVQQKHIHDIIAAHPTFAADAAQAVLIDLGNVKAAAEKALQHNGYCVRVWPTTKGSVIEEARAGATLINAISIVRMEFNPQKIAAIVQGNLVQPTASYSLAGNWPITTLVPGITYTWTKGANDVSLVNGTQTLFDTGTFVAQTQTVTLTGNPTHPVTATVVAQTPEEWFATKITSAISAVLADPPSLGGLKFGLADDCLEMMNFDEGILVYHIRFLNAVVLQ